METDTSDLVSAGILSKQGEDRVLHPVTFYSKKHSLAEANYEIWDKELIAMIQAFEERRAELDLVDCLIQVLSDHKNL